MSKTFCILPWIHMFISTTGTYRPCCVSSEFSNRHKVFEEAPEDYLNSEDVKNLRKQLLNNEKPNICKTCWDKEEKGNNYSKRLGELQIWKHINTNELIENTNEDGSYYGPTVSFDLRLGNLCNLKCVMCNPNSSSKWLEDKELLNKYENTIFYKNSLNNLKWPKKDDFWPFLKKNYKYVKQMHFAGGEPLLHKEHTNLLKDLVELGYAKNIALKYNTNITMLPDEVLNLWNNFKIVNVWASIDGINELNEFIRFPSKWNEIEESFSILDNTGPNVNVKVNTTVSAMNIFYIQNVYDFFVKKNYKKVARSQGSVHIAPDIVYDPMHLNVRLLSSDSKKLVQQIHNEHLKTVENEQYKMQMNYVLKYMVDCDQPEYQQKYVEYIQAIERVRKIKYPYVLRI